MNDYTTSDPRTGGLDRPVGSTVYYVASGAITPLLKYGTGTTEWCTVPQGGGGTPTTSDPRTAGRAGPIGALAMYVTAGAGTLLRKYGPVNTDWATVPVISGGGGALSDGDKGDITVTASGATWTIDAGVVTTTKMGGDVTTAGKALLDDATAADQRTTLGLAAIAASGSASDLIAGTVPAARMPALTGDVTTTAGAVATTLRNGAATSVLGRSAGTVGALADIAAAADGDVFRRAAGALGFGSIAQASVTSLTTDLAGKVPTARLINTTAPLTGGGDLTADRTLAISAFAGSAAGAVPASAGGTTNYLRADGTWAAPPGSGGGVTDGDKGDITVASGGTVWTIDANAVTLNDMAQVATGTILGRVTAATGNVEALTGTQATTLLDAFGASTKGLVPSPAGGASATTYLSQTGWNSQVYVPSWYGQIYGCYGGCDPAYVMHQMQRGGVIAATATNISTTVARCALFIPPRDLTIANLRFYAAGTNAAGIFHAAIYTYSDTAPTRLTADLSLTLTAGAWGAAAGGGVKVLKGVPYFVAVSATAANTVAGIQCIGTTVAPTTGQIQTAPQNLPGSLRASLNYLPGYLFGCTVAAGVLPATLGAPLNHGAWTGGMPAIFIDAA